MSTCFGRPDDGHIVVRYMQRWKNIVRNIRTKKNCAPNWLYLQDYLITHNLTSKIFKHEKESFWFRKFGTVTPLYIKVHVHCNLLRYKSNETPASCNTVQVLFLQSYSTCFGRKRPPSGVFKTSTAATGTCFIVAGQSSHLLIRAFGPNKEMWWLTCNDNTCTSGCCTSF